MIEENIIIHIGYDKVYQRFIAYNTTVQIVATGVCVTEAKTNFVNIAKSKNINVIIDED